jgi:HAMP domain-containing protein
VRLATKWFFWYLTIGVYVMVLGGVFYYNLFRWTFDEKLKQEAIDLVKTQAYQLIRGLSEQKSAIKMEEYQIVSEGIAKDDRIAFLVYFNESMEVRWFKDGNKIGQRIDEFAASIPFPTDAVAQALQSKTPKVRAVPGQPLYEIAIPLAVHGDLVGLVDMQVSRQGVREVISLAMRKYVLGAVGVLFLLGIPLFFFLHHFVLQPLLHLRDAIEAISFKNLDLKFPQRQDEIGEVASVVSVFLQKVKADRANTMVREKQRGVAEQRWWQSILTTIVAKAHRAIVVDEDNTVLYTNFPVSASIDPNVRRHLLDVIDSQQQDVLRLVGVALDRPNQVVETDTLFRQEPCHVRAVHLEEEGELRRTLILFEPKKASSGLIA